MPRVEIGERGRGLARVGGRVMVADSAKVERIGAHRQRVLQPYNSRRKRRGGSALCDIPNGLSAHREDNLIDHAPGHVREAQPMPPRPGEDQRRRVRRAEIAAV